jgi:hypothetical protein
MLRSNERLRHWYLRWLRRAVRPRDARLTVNILEGLSCCARLVVLVVAGRRRRAYKRSKADIRGTVVTFDTERSVEPGFLVAQTWCNYTVVPGCTYDGFRSNDDGLSDMIVLGLSSDGEVSAPDWLKESCWYSIHSTG